MKLRITSFTDRIAELRSLLKEKKQQQPPEANRNVLTSKSLDISSGNAGFFQWTLGMSLDGEDKSGEPIQPLASISLFANENQFDSYRYPSGDNAYKPHEVDLEHGWREADSNSAGDWVLFVLVKNRTASQITAALMVDVYTLVPEQYVISSTETTEEV